jgi:hypothetical protein
LHFDTFMYHFKAIIPLPSLMILEVYKEKRGKIRFGIHFINFFYDNPAPDQVKKKAPEPELKFNQTFLNLNHPAKAIICFASPDFCQLFQNGRSKYLVFT